MNGSCEAQFKRTFNITVSTINKPSTILFKYFDTIYMQRWLKGQLSLSNNLFLD